MNQPQIEGLLKCNQEPEEVHKVLDTVKVVKSFWDSSTLTCCFSGSGTEILQKYSNEDSGKSCFHSLHFAEDRSTSCQISLQINKPILETCICRWLIVKNSLGKGKSHFMQVFVTISKFICQNFKVVFEEFFLVWCFCCM